MILNYDIQKIKTINPLYFRTVNYIRKGNPIYPCRRNRSVNGFCVFLPNL